MESLSSKCFEEANSTDCLLRAIIDFLEDTQKKNEAEFEWDPITFGFTVSIALIAAGFALITIVQAVLAAGPGRRKSNSEAIGKWSRYTKRKWQFWDLGYLHVANTPILTVDNILSYLELKRTNVDKSDKSSESPPEDESKQPNRRSKSLAASAAKWLIFLDEVGLSHLELPDEALETWLADYLPSDLLAVPALIEVQLIYVFMSLFCKPFRVLGSDKKYPVLMGKDFQFEVRQHPTLGSIATFSKYNPGSLKISRRTTMSRIVLLEEQAKGIVHVSAGSEDLESGLPHETFMQIYESSNHFTVQVGKIDISRRMHLPWSMHHSNCALCSWTETTYSYDQTRGSDPSLPSLSSRSLFALMFANIPRAIPEIFPWGKFDLKGVFEALSISSDITIGDKLRYINGRTEKRKHLLHLIFRPHGQMSQRCPLPSFEDSDSSTCRCRRIIDTCTAMLQKDDVAVGVTSGITTEDLLQFRKDVTGFLFVVDSWLRRQCSQSQLSCAKFNLFSDTIQLQHVDKLLKFGQPPDIDALLSHFIRWYRGFIGTGDDSQCEFDYDGGIMLLELAKPVGIEELNIQDFMENPSLDGLLPISVVQTSPIREESEIVLDHEYFKLAYENIDIADLEKQLEQRADGDITPPDNCLIRRVLGWRVLLVTILYMTAFDNTDMLDSGSWNQILPML